MEKISPEEINKREEQRILNLSPEYKERIGRERAMVDKLSDYELLNEVVSEERNKTKEAKDMSWVDDLTSLKNIRAFNSEMPRIIGTEIRTDRDCSMVIIDIDDFKKINDTFGHSAGDQVLEQISRKMENAFRKEDFLCRMGGDEFVAILMDTNPGEILTGLEKIRNIIRKTDFDVVNNMGKKVTIRIKVSMGCCHLSQVGETKKFSTIDEKRKMKNDDLKKIIENMKKYADIALYDSKNYGKDGIAIYNPDINKANED